VFVVYGLYIFSFASYRARCHPASGDWPL